MNQDRLSKAIHQIKWEAERAMGWGHLEETRGYICALSYLMEYDEWRAWHDEFTARARNIIATRKG